MGVLIVGRGGRFMLILLTTAAAAFVATHLLMSHPLREPLVRALGANGFRAVYSLIAAATLVGTILAYRAAPTTAPLWDVGDGLWAFVTLVMLLASMLLLGSVVGNPAMPGTKAVSTARGVFAITRHPMGWSIALWAACHIAVYPVAKNIVVAVAMAVLGLVGSALQDLKKAKQQPEFWPRWQAMTSFWPFAAVFTRRAKLGRIGLHAILGGLVVWLAATWAHMPLSGWPAGIWRWL